MPNPGPASTITEHPIGGGGSPSYLGVSGGAVGLYQDPYGGGAVTQRQSAFQQVITVSQTAGLLVVAHANSQTEPTLTAQNISSQNITLTGAPMLSTADVVVLNKQVPLAQFGVANARVSVASVVQNTLILTIMGANLNTSGVSTTTPTGDKYMMAAFRGSIVNSVALTPTPIAPNSTVEQQFTVTGLAPGMVVAITKPSDQQSIGLGNARVVSNNVLGLTFINTANTTITPTAETYNFAAMAGAAPISPILTLGVNMSQAPVITVSGGALTYTNITVTGVQNTDQVIGAGQNIIFDNINITSSRILALVGGRVSTQVQNQILLTFLNPNTTSATNPITANSTDTWLVPMIRQNCEAPVTVYPGLVGAATVIGPNTCTEVGITVTGITVSCAVLAIKPSFTTGLAVLGYRVSSVASTGSTIGLTIGNPTSASATLPVETWQIAAFKPFVGVGHYAQQMVGPLNVQAVALTNEMRNTLAGMGIFQGF